MLFKHKIQSTFEKMYLKHCLKYVLANVAKIKKDIQNTPMYLYFQNKMHAHSHCKYLQTFGPGHVRFKYKRLE